MHIPPLPDFPYTPRTIPVLGSHMAVIDEGAGDDPVPLLLVHGNPTWSYLWRKVVPVLAGSRRVLAPDLIGHGRSGKPDIAYRLVDHIRFFDALMEHLGLDRVVLVLHDWGGSVGLDWARRHPERVAGVVLTETRIRVYDTWDDVSPGARRRFLALRAPETGWALTAHDDVFFTQTIPDGIPGITAQEVESYRAPHVDPNSRVPLWRWVNELPIEGHPEDVARSVHDCARWLRTAAVPTLLATVDPGAIIDPATAREWDALPHVSSVPLGPGGHFVPDEHGLDLAHAISRWLPRIR